MDYDSQIQCHYERRWGVTPARHIWTKGPTHELSEDFCVLEFAPRPDREMWTYATCCMSEPSDVQPLEIHLFSPVRSEVHVELLTVISHYHRTGATLGLGHVVNFGRPWMECSRCSFGLISLPYLDGPKLEHFTCREGTVRCLWLIPISAAERAYAKTHGVDALELKFEERRFNYLDPNRVSVVPDDTP